MCDSSGTNEEIIDDLDGLRHAFGDDSVDVLTPIIEKRIRAGQGFSRPLRVSIHLEGRRLTILLNFLASYPRVPLGVQVNVRDDFLFSEAMQQMADHANRRVSENGLFTRAVELVNEIKKDFHDTKPDYGATPPITPAHSCSRD